MITLFEGAADASTLFHELGHYTFETMRKLVERGLADERMTDDWNKLLKAPGHYNARPGVHPAEAAMRFGFDLAEEMRIFLKKSCPGCIPGLDLSVFGIRIPPYIFFKKIQ